MTNPVNSEPTRRDGDSSGRVVNDSPFEPVRVVIRPPTSTSAATTPTTITHRRDSPRAEHRASTAASGPHDHAPTPPTLSRQVPPATRSDARNEDRETEEALHEVEQTRLELGHTLEALHERLRPKRLVDEAKDAARDAASELIDNAKSSVKDATIGRAERMARDVTYRAEDTGSSLMDTIRENPLPAALAGLSLGWLFMNRSSSRPSHRYDRYGYNRADDYGFRAYGGAGYGSVGRTAGGGRGVGQVVGQVTEQAKETVGEVADRASDVVSSAGDMVGTAGERAGEMAGVVGERASDAGSTLWDTVRRNPLPATMMAVGLGMMLRGGSGGSAGRDRYRQAGRTYGYGTGYDAGAYSYGSTTSSSSMGGSRSSYGTGYQVGEKVGDAAMGAVETVTDAASAAGEQVQQIRRGAGQQVERAQTQLERMLEEQPLAVGAAVVGLGAAVGLLVPRTEPEGQWMGEAREAVMERAQEAMQEVGERVQRVASEVGSTARETARAEGLTSQ